MLTKQYNISYVPAKTKLNRLQKEHTYISIQIERIAPNHLFIYSS